MDRGRIIENIQKVNAVNIDKYGKTGKISTRVINPQEEKTIFHQDGEMIQNKRIRNLNLEERYFNKIKNKIIIII